MARTMVALVCDGCRRTFVVRRDHAASQRFCSRACAASANSGKPPRVLTAAGRARSARMKELHCPLCHRAHRWPRVCPCCHRTYLGPNAYCSRTCAEYVDGVPWKCPRCGRVDVRFYVRQDGRRSAYCSVCASEITKAFARAHPGYKQEGLRRVKKWAKKVGYQHEKRRKRYAPQGVPFISRREWRIIREAFGNRCAYCHQPSKQLQKDHFLPISSGGEHSWRNTVPACPKCNNTKNARPPSEWIKDEASRHFIADTMARIVAEMS